MQTIPAFYFDPAELARRAAAQGESFRTAKPFQHVVLEDFVPREVMALLVREFPKPDDIDWELHGPGRTEWTRDKRIAKLATSDETKFGAFTRHFMAQLNSATFLRFLEELTGIPELLPDVTYSHCGLHSTGPGGRLMMHTDVNRHPHGTKMHQILNLIVFLNEDWKEEYGGHLELWDTLRKPVHRYLPRANRAVLFNTGTNSLHGHPHPLTCPPDRRRNSLAVYYYLRDRPITPEYTGAQRAVHWVAATPEDEAYALERGTRARAELEPLRGHVVHLGTSVIPFPLPEGFADPRSSTVPLYFLQAHEVRDAGAFAARHARAAVASHGGSAEEFLAAQRPFALLGATSGTGPFAHEPFACLLDARGEMSVVRGADSPELFWVGYLDEIMARLPRS
jgi:2-oxoglutarate-Fe(II)-dependent oxygenase superfamily protein